MRALVTIAGVDIPDPSTYESITSTVVDSARNTEGVMIGAVIRDDVSKVSMSWRFLEVEKWAKILSLFSTAQGGSFVNEVTFFSQDYGTWITKQMYVNDRKANIYLRNDDGDIIGFKDCAIALIQV